MLDSIFAWLQPVL